MMLSKLRLFNYYLLVCGLVCLFSLPSLEAQRRETLFDEMTTIGAFKRLDLSYDCKVGQTIVLTAEVAGRRKLKWIVVREPSSDMLHVAKRTYGFERKRITVHREGAHLFTFRNRGLIKRNVRVLIQREAAELLKDTMLLEDLVVSSSLDSIPETYIDTLPFPDVSQHSFLLAPTLDYVGLKDTCVLEELLDTDFQFAVYWIGIGDKTLEDYNALKASPPPNWVLKGINEPLLAYGLGLTEQLPEARTALAQRISSKFTNPGRDLSDPNAPRPEVKIGDRLPTYGFIPMDKAGKHRKLLLCIRNFNANSPVNIHVKFAKFTIAKGVRQKYIIRERMQEVYVKEKVLDRQDP